MKNCHGEVITLSTLFHLMLPTPLRRLLEREDEIMNEAKMLPPTLYVNAMSTMSAVNKKKCFC